MANDVKWIKITTDIFDDEKILMIESMPSADSIIVIWFKLLAFAGKQNNNGVFLMSNRIAYTDEMLASIFRRDVNTVRLALRAFEQFGMIEIIDNVITIPNWGKHQTLDAYEKKKERDRARIARKRAEQKALIAMSPDVSPDSSPDTSPVVAFLEEDKEKEEERESDNKNKTINYQQIVDMYNSICASLPRVRSLSEARKKAIRARLNTYTVEDFKTLFEMAESSDFLKGSSESNWTANFDWLIKDANMAKVLDGNYANKPKRYGRKEPVPGWMNKPREIDDDEAMAIRRMLGEDAPPTLGSNPDLAKRAEELQKRLQG